MLETLIDMCLAGGYHRVRGCSLAAYIRGAEMPLLELHDHLDKTWLRDEDTERFAEGLLSSFRLFSFLQSLYRNRLLGRCVPFLSAVSPLQIRAVLALVYSPRLMGHCWRIEGDIPCLHPSTGEMRSQNIRALFQDAVDRSVEFCLGLEPVFGSGSSAPGAWSLPPVDPSLGFGPGGSLRFFAPGRFFD